MDPEFTQGGLSARQMRELNALRLSAERANKAMMMRAAGYSTYEKNLEIRREKDRAKRQARKDRTARNKVA